MTRPQDDELDSALSLGEQARVSRTPARRPFWSPCKAGGEPGIPTPCPFGARRPTGENRRNLDSEREGEVLHALVTNKRWRRRQRDWRRYGQERMSVN